MLKALFVLRYLHFCPDVLGMLKKRLYKRVMVKFKIHDSQTGQQIITIHIYYRIYQEVLGARILLFKNYAENELGRLVPDLFLFFKKLYLR